MKTILVISCLSIALLCGCSSMDSERLLGARTANWTICTVPDSEANRAVVGEICASVAKQCNLRDDAQRVGTVSQGVGVVSNVVVAAYAADCSETPKQPIWLEASVEQGKFSVSLFHAKWHKVRTARYTEIQDTLVSDIRKRFGTQANIQIYDEVIK